MQIDIKPSSCGWKISACRYIRQKLWHSLHFLKTGKKILKQYGRRVRIEEFHMWNGNTETDPKWLVNNIRVFKKTTVANERKKNQKCEAYCLTPNMKLRFSFLLSQLWLNGKKEEKKQYSSWFQQGYLEWLVILLTQS